MSVLRLRFVTVVALSGVLAAGTVVPARAQSLAELAQKSKEAREKAAADRAKAEAEAKAKPTGAAKDSTSKAPAKKTYTNDDLKALPPSPDTAPALSGPPVDSAKAGTSESPKQADAATSPAKKDEPPVKDEAYWRARWTPIAKRISGELAKNVELTRRIYDLTVELGGIGPLNARRAGVETERQRLITESEALELTIAGDKAELAAIVEEGRRADALPGWFR